tara:strand:+ start:788 stop:1087 length:300 start_codon:yes stop_codon:yes gene_type:complete
MLTLIVVVSVIVITALVTYDIKRSRKQQPEIGALLMELSAKEQGILKAYRGQIAEEEAEHQAAIDWAAKELGFDKKARAVPTIPKCWASDQPPYLKFKR